MQEKLEYIFEFLNFSDFTRYFEQIHLNQDLKKLKLDNISRNREKIKLNFKNAWTS